MTAEHDAGYAQYFGRDHLGTIRGASFIFGISGAALGPCLRGERGLDRQLDEADGVTQRAGPRRMAAAGRGRTRHRVITERVREACQGTLLLEDRGSPEPKGVAQPIRLHRMLVPEEAANRIRSKRLLEAAAKLK